MLLDVVLWALFTYSLLLKNVLRTMTVYLRLNGSVWENDWQQYNSKRGAWAYTKSQGVVFSLMIVLSTLAPHVLGRVYQTSWPSREFCAVHIITGSVALLFVVTISFPWLQS
jgi:hypothetical protein